MTQPSDPSTQCDDATTEGSEVLLSATKRALFSAGICLFILFHLGLSMRGALLQDDRFAWRMFHNIGFSQVKYAWVKSDGRTKHFRPNKESLVKRSHLYLLPQGGWRPTYYSEGTTRNMVDNYARYMGENKRPEWAVAFRATLKMRINDEQDFVEHVYEYPKVGK